MWIAVKSCLSKSKYAVTLYLASYIFQIQISNTGGHMEQNVLNCMQSEDD